MLVSIYRYNPETDDKPYAQSLEIKLPEGKDLMVLDVLALAKQEDPSVAYRRSCREGVYQYPECRRGPAGASQDGYGDRPAPDPREPGAKGFGRDRRGTRRTIPARRDTR